MSLTSLVRSKKYRELFKSIAVDKTLFCSSNEDEPFSSTKSEISSTVTNAGLVGTAFDYLLRAQVAQWRNELEQSLHWTASKGLGMLLSTRYTLESNPGEDGWMHALYPNENKEEWIYFFCFPGKRIFNDEGFVAEHVLKSLKQAPPLIAEDANNLLQVTFRYQAVRKLWRQFIQGREISPSELISAVLFLAKLEQIYRSNWWHKLGGLKGICEEILKEVNDETHEDILMLWEIFKKQRRFFESAKRCVYNPEFGYASILVGGADADLLLDTTLVEVKTTKNPSYKWTDAAQLVGYYVLAAMAGKPWPINCLSLYKARFGRFEYVKTDVIRRKLNLLDFAEELIKHREEMFIINLTIPSSKGYTEKQAREIIKTFQKKIKRNLK